MESEVDEMIAKAVEMHEKGMRLEADRPDESLQFFKMAIRSDAKVSQYWASYIEVLIRLGRINDARIVLKQAKGKGAKGRLFDNLDEQIEKLAKGPRLEQLQILSKLCSEGQVEEALNKTTKLLERFPQSVDLNNICGVCHLRLKQIEIAIESFKRAIKIKPDFADPYNNLGNALYAGGRVGAAIDVYKKAIEVKPDYALAYYNMGSALQEIDKIEAAIVSYRQATKINPDYADAYNNLGIALWEQGEIAAAIDSYKRAIKINPNYADAYNNMGTALKDKGEIQAAIESYKAAIKIKPDFAVARSNIGAALKEVAFNKPDLGLQSLITKLLDEGAYVSPKDIAQAAISLVRFDPFLQQTLEKHARGELALALQETITGLSRVSLLLGLMRVCPITDLGLEDLFKSIRSYLLLLNHKVIESPEAMHFQSALALQCFTNEYIYDQTAAESAALANLECLVKEGLLIGRQPNSQSILCLASYKALNDYEWSKLLKATSHTQEVLRRQIVEPNEEGRLKSDIASLQNITDETSSLVRAQYEENPYPRWVKLRSSVIPKNIAYIVKTLNLQLGYQGVLGVESPSILIAGCGTGQHPILTSCRFQNSKVLAVDLSLSSLAYAKRKTKELGIQNIEYMHADILDLEELGRKFDIIESSGVLHHMKDPKAGWRILTNCLRTNGLMQIGLYSELARRDIMEVRREIQRLRLEVNESSMKTFRSTMVNSGKEHHKKIISIPDFYSSSMLRDLLFHVEEHRFSLLQIKDWVADLGLRFCGFENEGVVRDFQQIFPQPDDLFNLEKWDSFERMKPESFLGMYQFWCQKIT